MTECLGHDCLFSTISQTLQLNVDLSRLGSTAKKQIASDTLQLAAYEAQKHRGVVSVIYGGSLLDYVMEQGRSQKFVLGV